MKEKIIKIAPLLVFVVILGSTFGAWRVTQSVVNAEIERNFYQEVQVAKHWMQDRLNLYLPMALGMRLFFESSDAVTAREWSAYIQKLKLIDKYPAISTLTYIERVRVGGKDSYLVKYVEPSDALNESKEAIGTNISLNQTRLDLFNSVRDEDPTSMGRVTLVTTPKKGFDIILPVYRAGPTPVTVEERRAALKGFIQVEFAGNRLFQDIFDTVDASNLSFEVYSNLPSKENLLYEQGLDYSNTTPNYKPEITHSETFEFNGQRWYLAAATKPDYRLTPSQERLPLVVLGSGVIASLTFLGIYLYMNQQTKDASFVAKAVS